MVNAIIRWCLNNTLLVIITMLAVIGGGWYAMQNVPIDAIPDIGEKQVIVVAEWPGRSPQDVDDQVTYPLTVALQGTPGVKVIRSMSGFGFSMVFVIVHDRVDYYWARSRVLERLSVAKQRLPAGVEPVLGPDATALGQVFWYTVEGEGFDLGELRSLQDWYIRYQLNAVEGVSEVASIGGHVKQYQIDVDPVKMRAHGVTLPEITEAVRRSNIDVGAKAIEINQVEFFIRGVGFIKKPADLENVVIRAVNGTPLYVKNVATVSVGPEFRRGTLDKEGVEAVGGVVVMRYGENPLRVLERVKEKIEQISPGLPAKTLPDGRVSKVKIVSFYDRTTIIHETMDTLKEALTEEALVASLVVFVFLLHLRSSLAIVAATLPTSVGISFLVMYALGVDSNIMSLAGLAIAIGDVCDMGLIMTENIYRHIAKNDGSKTYYQCVEEGAFEVGTAIVTAVSNTIVSFIPVFALTDQEGKLFGPLAYTKTFAITASAILAVTVVPTLSYYLLKPTRWSRRRSILVAGVAGAAMTVLSGWAFREFFLPADSPIWRGWLMAAATGVITVLVLYRMARERLLPLEENIVSRGILKVYVPSLRWVLQNKILFLSIPIALVLMGLCIWLGWGTVGRPVELALAKVDINVNQWKPWSYLKHKLPGLGREFMPALDEGSFLYMPSLVPAGSLNAVVEVMSQQNMAMRTVPEVESVVGKAGRVESALDPAPIGMVETIVLLKPAEQWRPVEVERFYQDWPDWAKAPLRSIWPERRRITKDEILEELRKKTDIPGVLPSWLQPIQTRIVMLQSGFRAMMGVKIFGSDLKEIEKVGLELEKILREVPGATDVVADRIVGKPYVEYRIDREKLARYGVNIRDVQDVIEIAIGGENLTTSVEGRERYPIRVRYPRELRDNLEELERVLVPTAGGAHIPIGQVANIQYTLGPQEIKSENTLLVGYVTMNTRERDEVSVVEDAKALVDAKIKSGEFNLPKGYYLQWAGQYENQVRAMNRLKLLIPLCLLLDFVLLYMGFNRWWVALLVFAGIIVSASGGFLMLLFYGFNLSVAVWVGFIALFGVAEDDGVVMATYLGQLFEERTPNSIQEVRDIVVEAGMKRIRPCLMTTATTVLGLLPVFWAVGRGSDVMQPMAIPSVGGMAIQLITLFIVPCVYCWVEEMKLRRRLRGEPHSAASV
ncbi:MAG: efflux RND transporter permease subunit [Pirellulales bacterium]|nr:efflux RND transporter permease subunit [Pirellulales bacterium]